METTQLALPYRAAARTDDETVLTKYAQVGILRLAFQLTAGISYNNNVFGRAEFPGRQNRQCSARVYR